MEELISIGASYQNRYIYSLNDMLYAFPGHLCGVYKVERKENLLNKYIIYVHVSKKAEYTEEIDSTAYYEEICKQITLIDIILPIILS